MSDIDVEELLAPVSSDEPCGEDLEYDNAYIEMERLTQGKPEQQFGDTVIEAEEPQWKEARKRAVALLERTKDLRVATLLTQALLHTDGLDGLRDGCQLLLGLVDRYWDNVHPQLDPDDDDDPTMRVNTITSLCDPVTVLRYVREAPLAEAKGLGQVSLRDLDIIAGRASATGSEHAPEAAAVEGILMECPVEELQARAEQLDRTIAAVEAIEARLTELLGASSAPDLSALPDVLKSARHELAERLAKRGVTQAPETAADEAVPESGPPPVTTAGGAVAAQPIRGEIASREDVVKMLDKLCDYFQRHEPSSPVPLLLRRAQRLVHMDFLDIMRDLAPDGMHQVETIRGPQEGASSSENE